MPLLAEYIPKNRRELVGLEGEAHLGRALNDKVLALADLRYARQVALDVGGEDGNAGSRKPLRHDLKRDRLPGPGRTGDEAVAVRKRKRQPGRLLALADKDLLIGIRHIAVGWCHRAPPVLVPFAVWIDHTSSCNAIETGQRAPNGVVLCRVAEWFCGFFGRKSKHAQLP